MTRSYNKMERWEVSTCVLVIIGRTSRQISTLKEFLKGINPPKISLKEDAKKPQQQQKSEDAHKTKPAWLK